MSYITLFFTSLECVEEIKIIIKLQTSLNLQLKQLIFKIISELLMIQIQKKIHKYLIFINFFVRMWIFKLNVSCLINLKLPVVLQLVTILVIVINMIILIKLLIFKLYMLQIELVLKFQNKLIVLINLKNCLVIKFNNFNMVVNKLITKDFLLVIYQKNLLMLIVINFQKLVIKIVMKLLNNLMENGILLFLHSFILLVLL